MLAIGVRLPRRFEDAGEFLADARALDSASVHSLWLDGDGHDPWLLLAGIAAVTGRIRLVAPVTAADSRAPSAVRDRLSTLHRLSRGRVALGSAAESADPRSIEAVAAVARDCGCRLILSATGEEEARAAARVADGVVDLDSSPQRLGEILDAARALRPAAPGAFEAWAQIAMPADAPEWRRVRDAYGAAGATGLVIAADARLLDLLRNGDEEDDRSDLALAQG